MNNLVRAYLLSILGEYYEEIGKRYYNCYSYTKPLSIHFDEKYPGNCRITIKTLDLKSILKDGKFGGNRYCITTYIKNNYIYINIYDKLNKKSKEFKYEYNVNRPLYFLELLG